MNYISRSQLKRIEEYADILFKEFGIDIEFQNLYKGTHFFDRLNDPRNETPITADELRSLFKKVSRKYGKELATAKSGIQGVLKDMESDVNMPFIMKWDQRNSELDLVPKTVMKKKNFYAKDREYTVESLKLKPLMEDILSEGKQVGTVYHFTRFARLIMIINNDLLKANKISSQHDTPTVSTTRDKNFIKHGQNKQLGSLHLGLVLNGTAMSNKYQVRPMSDAYGPATSVAWGDEKEEIWYGKQLERDGGIKNIRKYLEKIIITKPGYKFIINRPDYFNGQSAEEKAVVDSEIGPLNSTTIRKKRLKMVTDWLDKHNIKYEFQ